VFIRAELKIPLPLGIARKALDQALADGGLVAESRRALTDNPDLLMSVGPLGGSGLLAKDVLVHALPSRAVGTVIVVPLRWQAVGPMGRLFPALDANLNLVSSGTDTLLSIVGSYQPPLGRFGRVLDRVAMQDVANATLHALASDVADQILQRAGQAPS
jgi:hypothetical protein